MLFRNYAIASLIFAGFFATASSLNAQITGFGGSTMTGWTPNANSFSSAQGVPNVSGTGTSADVLNLTTASGSEASSYWFNTAQNITNFTESFTYTDSSTNGADGIAAVWQNVGTNALGGGGGSLGFANLGSSAGLSLNIYSGNSGSASGFNNAVTTGNPAQTPTPGGVNIDSGDPINVSLSYKESDSALTETMTDTITSQTFTRVWRNVSIQSQVGSTMALVGFTGATGGVNAAQSITNFRFTPGAAAPTPVAQITPINVTGYTQNMIISATNGAANVTATMDGGTAKSGDTFYERGVNTGATSSGLPASGVVFGSANDSNHSFVFAPNGQGQNDALMLDASNTSGALALSTPARYSTLSFLVAGGNGGATAPNSLVLTINYAGGGTQITALDAPDWFNNSPIAVDANGRGTTGLAFDSVTGGNPRIYQEDVVLSDTTDPVTSVSFAWPQALTGGNRAAVFGVSGLAVPEPASWALLGIGAIGLLARKRRSRRGK